MTFTWRFNHTANPQWRAGIVIGLALLVDDLRAEGYDAELKAGKADPEKSVILNVSHPQGTQEFSALLDIEYDRGLPLRKFCNEKLLVTRPFFPVNDHDRPGPVVRMTDPRPENVLRHGFHVTEVEGRAALKRMVTRWVGVERTRKLQKLQQGAKPGI